MAWNQKILKKQKDKTTTYLQILLIFNFTFVSYAWSHYVHWHCSADLSTDYNSSMKILKCENCFYFTHKWFLLNAVHSRGNVLLGRELHIGLDAKIQILKCLRAPSTWYTFTKEILGQQWRLMQHSIYLLCLQAYLNSYIDLHLSERHYYNKACTHFFKPTTNVTYLWSYKLRPF